MLYVFHGSDRSASLAKARALIGSLRTKRPDAAFIEIDTDHWTPSVIEEHLGGQGLFSNKYIVFLNRLTELEEAKEVLPEFAEAMNESANIFIILETKPNAELGRAFEKSAEKVVVSEETKKAPVKEAFNIFALGGALDARDGLKAWKLYRQAIDDGIAPENIVGTLFWQVKKGFGRPGSKKLLTDLITLYHDGHRGKVDLELGIERMLVLL